MQTSQTQKTERNPNLESKSNGSYEGLAGGTKIFGQNKWKNKNQDKNPRPQ